MRKVMLTLAAGAAVVTLGSVAFWQLSEDGPRRQGALGATTIDPVPLSWRGAWTADARLAPGEVVSHQGSAFVAQEDNSGVAPTCVGQSGCPWALMAARGPLGPSGPAGAQGSPGPQGPGGPLSGLQVVTTSTFWKVSEYASTSVSCPSGKKAIGGGFDGGEPALGVEITASRPQGASAWIVSGHNRSAGDRTIQFYVVCANAS